MTEMKLHAMPRWRDVLVEQIRVVGLGLRREAAVVAVFLGVGTAIIVGDLIHGGPAFDSIEMFPTHLISLIFPYIVWRGQPRFGPAFLWTFPVDRRRLVLARVFAGGVWLGAALTVFASWLLVLSLVAHVPPERNLMRVPYVATIAVYLFSTAVLVGLRHPLRWLAGTAGVLFLMGFLSELLGNRQGANLDAFLRAIGFTPTAYTVAAAWYAWPFPVRSSIAALISIGAGALAVLAAAWRHKETR
jgi:hypothetical protein